MRDAAVESVAVGFFDGVHLGHQAILHGAKTAITFRNHPLTVLAPARAPRLIMSLEDRLTAIQSCGVDDVIALDFTEALAREPPEAFMRRLGSHVRCGENWHFGAQGAGDAAFLRAHGVSVEVIPFSLYKNERISSTRIRAALESGHIADASAMLGRTFRVSGRVFRGKGEGAKLGFPTLNLHLNLAIRLPFGVYAAEMMGRRAIVNYGLAPTMGTHAWNKPCLEVHMLDGFAIEGEDECAVVTLHDFIRAERKFATANELKAQINLDIETVTQLHRRKT